MTAFFVMRHFLSVNTCGEVGLFYNDLQDRIDVAYSGGITQDVFSGKLPSDLEYVCFGNMTRIGVTGQDDVIRVRLKEDLFGREGNNVFLYPVSKACDSEFAYHTLKHVEVDRFFCSEIGDGEGSVKISKGSKDALVLLSK